MAPPDSYGWTVVSRGRRPFDHRGQRPIPPLLPLPTPSYGNRGQTHNHTYADAVRYGDPARPQPRYQTRPGWVPSRSPQRGERPPQGYYRPQTFHAEMQQNRNRYTQRPHTRPYNHPTARQTIHITEPQPRDAVFISTSRTMLKLIKVVHHKNNMAQTPPFLTKMEQHLTEMIKPALPNTTTQMLIEGNAKNWAFSTMLILKQHYEDALQSESDKLQQNCHQQWEECYSTAIQWAKRDLGRRLKDKSIHETHALIQRLIQTLIAEQTTDTPTTSEPTLVPENAEASPDQNQNADSMHTAPTPLPPPPSPPPPPPSPPPEGNQTTDIVNRSRQVEALMTNVSGSPPDLVSQQTQSHNMPVSTRTDHRGDWSPFSNQEENPEAEASPNRDLLPSDGEPKEQRVTLVTPRKTLFTNNTGAVISDSEMFNTIEVIESSSPGTIAKEPTHTRASTSKEPTHTDASTSQELTHTEKTENPKSQTQTILTFQTNSTKGLQCQAQDGKPTRHINTTRKMTEWNLQVKKKIIIIGDSNLAKISSFTNTNLQIESYPGATFRNMEAVCQKAPTSPEVEHLIISCGINSRSVSAKDTAIKQLQGAIRIAKQTFPVAQIWIPVVNYCRKLPQKDQTQLDILNSHIIANTNHFPPLSLTNFKTEADNIHWTNETANKMLDSWLTHLK